jgi:UDP-N-acetyl-D-glucosamine dehydrogenase
VRPILETSGLKAGQDFTLAYSPEREDPGNKQFSLTSIPKVVGGFDERSREAAVSLYSLAFKTVVPVSSCEVAEAAKLLENTYRLVNIALVSELKHAFAAMGVDVWEVIEAAKTKPFGFAPFYPGTAGGHCIPIDPAYLTYAANHAKRPARCRLVERAIAANRNEISHAIIAVGYHTPPGGKVCILGLAYKKDIDDVRESPGWALLSALDRGKYVVSYSDPHLPAVATRHSKTLTPEFVASQDAVVIATDHTAFDYGLLAEHARLIIDTRNAMAGRQCRGKVVKV